MCKRLVFLASLLPTTAFASGSEILSLFWLELAVFSIVVVSLCIRGLSAKGKISVFAAYLIGVAIPLLITKDWSYRVNIVQINFLCAGIPFLFWLVSYIYIRCSSFYPKKNGKKNK